MVLVKAQKHCWALVGILGFLTGTAQGGTSEEIGKETWLCFLSPHLFLTSVGTENSGGNFENLRLQPISRFRCRSGFDENFMATR